MPRCMQMNATHVCLSVFGVFRNTNDHIAGERLETRAVHIRRATTILMLTPNVKKKPNLMTQLATHCMHKSPAHVWDLCVAHRGLAVSDDICVPNACLDCWHTTQANMIDRCILVGAPDAPSTQIHVHFHGATPNQLVRLLNVIVYNHLFLTSTSV